MTTDQLVYIGIMAAGVVLALFWKPKRKGKRRHSVTVTYDLGPGDELIHAGRVRRASGPQWMPEYYDDMYDMPVPYYPPHYPWDEAPRPRRSKRRVKVRPRVQPPPQREELAADYRPDLAPHSAGRLEPPIWM